MSNPEPEFENPQFSQMLTVSVGGDTLTPSENQTQVTSNIIVSD